MSELYLGNYVVIGYPANWRTRPKLSYILLTSIAEDTPGAEKRGVMYAKIRASIEWLVSGFDAESSSCVEETLRVAQEAQKAAAPNWLSERTIKSIDGNILTLSAVPDPAFETGQTIWWGKYMGFYGLATVRSVSGTQVTLDSIPDDLAADFDPDSHGAKYKIAPMILGRIDGDPSVKGIDGAAREWTIKLVETSGSLSGATRTVEDAVVAALNLTGKYWTEIQDDDETEDDSGTAGLGFSGTMQQIVFESTDGAVEDDGGSVAIGMSGVMTQIAFLLGTETSAATATLGFSGVMS